MKHAGVQKAALATPARSRPLARPEALAARPASAEPSAKPICCTVIPFPARPTAPTATPPPYNIEKAGENAYKIVVAVAGFADSELNVTQKENELLVTGQTAANG